MLFPFIKIPKSVTQSSPLLEENRIDKNEINMFGYTFLKDGCYQGFFFSPPDGTLSDRDDKDYLQCITK